MGGLFESGGIVDLLLILIVGEGILLWAYCQRQGKGTRAVALIPNLAAGASLLLALKSALTDSDWPLIAMWLFTALVAHLLDLRSRLRN